eukprot:Phypoly_transcript_09730.p1 GENE.Phypoly_transcript_09730~~Phypoly_transcript_09730.p1  ORF type:complete len:342 (+),score=35.46 Phypoly_transcript_09730:306-1331(+)
MEFHHLGSHCSFPDCKQLDFLPFKCDACGDTFCLDHRTQEAHRCRFAGNTDRRALVCPICNNPIVALPSQDPNIVLDDHINQGCAVKASTGYKCNMKGCKKVDVMAIICKSCRRHHCVKHRFEDAHNCPRNPQIARTKQPPKQNTPPTTNSNPKTTLHPTSSPKQTNSQNANNNTNAYPGTYTNTSTINNNNSNNNNYNRNYHSPPTTTNNRLQSTPSYTVNSTETTVGVRLTNGELLRRTCSSNTTLRDVQLFIDQTRTDGSAPYVMRTTYPPKELSFSDLDKTLAQLGLVPSGMIILQPLQFEEPPAQNTTESPNDPNANLGWWGVVTSFLGSFVPSSS